MNAGAYEIGARCDGLHAQLSSAPPAIHAHSGNCSFLRSRSHLAEFADDVGVPVEVGGDEDRFGSFRRDADVRGLDDAVDAVDACSADRASVEKFVDNWVDKLYPILL